VYDGKWVAGQRNGIGGCAYANGDTYVLPFAHRSLSCTLG
jgi:hypothetical protein